MNLFAPIANVGPGNSPLAGIFLFRASPRAQKAASVSFFKALHLQLVIPYGMTLKDWADSFVLVMAHITPLPQLENDFESWAQEIVQTPVFSAFQLPHATNANQWVDWAERVNTALVGAQ